MTIIRRRPDHCRRRESCKFVSLKLLDSADDQGSTPDSMDTSKRISVPDGHRRCQCQMECLAFPSATEDRMTADRQGFTQCHFDHGAAGCNLYEPHPALVPWLTTTSQGADARQCSCGIDHHIQGDGTVYLQGAGGATQRNHCRSGRTIWIDARIHCPMANICDPGGRVIVSCTVYAPP